MTSTVQAWTRVGNGPWSPLEAISGDAKALAALIAGARAVLDMEGKGAQIQLFSAGHNPNNR